MKRIFLVIMVIGILLLGACSSPTTEQQTCTLNINISPPEGGFVSCPSDEYEPNTQVALTAIPSSGYTFDYWEGDVSGSSSTINIVIDSDKSVIAHFKELPSPVFSEVEIYDILESTATIQWDTNEPATFKVEYGTSNAYGLVTSDTVWKDATDWGRVILTELKPKTTYHFRICAIDEDGNQALSNDYVFTTLTPHGLFSARLFPFIIGGFSSADYNWVTRLNTTLFNGSTQAITVTKIEFLDEDGGVAFTLPISATDDDYYICFTLGRSDLPELWKDEQLAAGKLFFTGIEFDRVQPSARELEGWQVKWYCLDAEGVEFIVTGDFSLLP